MSDLTSKRKAAANAQNAKLSTGPRTNAGLARTARNATKHAIYSATPVLPGIERQEEWSAHVANTVAAVAPATYLERALAERAALLLWRLGRVTRYEVQTASGAIATVPDDVAEQRRERITYLRENVPVAVDQAREDTTTLNGDVEALERFVTAAADAPISHHDVRTLLALFLNEGEVTASELANVQRPADGWTRASLLSAVELQADDIDEHLLDARERAADAARKLANIETEALRMVAARMLPDAPTLEKVQRYEGHLERSLFRTLQELRRMRHGEGE